MLTLFAVGISVGAASVTGERRSCEAFVGPRLDVHQQGELISRPKNARQVPRTPSLWLTADVMIERTPFE